MEWLFSGLHVAMILGSVGVVIGCKIKTKRKGYTEEEKAMLRRIDYYGR